MNKQIARYRSALKVAEPNLPNGALISTLQDGGAHFQDLVTQSGLAPFWHNRTNISELHAIRMAAEAQYMAQSRALLELAVALDTASIRYVVIKGAANRELLYTNPALRQCADLDVLVRFEDRLRAAQALMDIGFVPAPDPLSIGREIILSKGTVDIDLHWGLLRDGRLRVNLEDEMLDRRITNGKFSTLAPEDGYFLLLVHPAFAKHISSREMALHRVLDILEWHRTVPTDRAAVLRLCDRTGTVTAAWAVLRWLELLTGEPCWIDAPHVGRCRRAYLDFWLRNDLSGMLESVHPVRLLLLTAFFHDTAPDMLRALFGRLGNMRQRRADIAPFLKLKTQK